MLHKLPRWVLILASLALAAVGYRLHPGITVQLPAPPTPEPLRTVEVPIIPFVGTRLGHEIGKPEAVLRQRMGPPVITNVGAGLDNAYAGAYGLVHTGGVRGIVYALEFDFDLVERELNVAPTLVLTIDGKRVRLNGRTTPAQLERQFHCDSTRVGPPQRSNTSYGGLRPTDGGVCRLARATDGDSLYLVTGAGIGCSLHQGRLKTVSLYSRETAHYLGLP